MGSEVNPGQVRALRSNVLQSIRIPFTFADQGKVMRSQFKIPAGSLLHKPLCGVQVEVPFNAGTNNLVNVGIVTDTDKYGTVLSLLAATFVPFDEAVAMVLAVDAYLVAELALTGTAATLGAAELVAVYSTYRDAPVQN